jgi:hypothetical protein
MEVFIVSWRIMRLEMDCCLQIQKTRCDPLWLCADSEMNEEVSARRSQVGSCFF